MSGTGNLTRWEAESEAERILNDILVDLTREDIDYRLGEMSDEDKALVFQTLSQGYAQLIT